MSPGTITFCQGYRHIEQFDFLRVKHGHPVRDQCGLEVHFKGMVSQRRCRKIKERVLGLKENAKSRAYLSGFMIVAVMLINVF